MLQSKPIYPTFFLFNVFPHFLNVIPAIDPALPESNLIHLGIKQAWGSLPYAKCFC